MKWSDVTSSPTFETLSDEKKEQARVAYFDSYIAPKVKPEQLQDIRTKWDEMTIPEPGFVENRWNDLKRGGNQLTRNWHMSEAMRSKGINDAISYIDQNQISNSREGLKRFWQEHSGKDFDHDSVNRYLMANDKDRAYLRDKILSHGQRSVAGVVKDTADIESIPYSKSREEFNQSQSFGEAWDKFTDAPLEVASSLTTESLPQVAPAFLAFLGGPVTGAAAMGGTSFGNEYYSDIIGSMQEAGINIKNTDDIVSALSDEETMNKWKEHATKRGVPIGMIDAISGGLAGRVLMPLAKTGAGKTIAGAGEALVMQPALGMSGEVAGSLAAGDDIEGRDVLAEGLGEIVPGSIETSIGAYSQARQARKKQLEQIQQDAETVEQSTQFDVNADSEMQAAMDELIVLDEAAKQSPVQNLQVADLDEPDGAVSPEHEYDRTIVMPDGTTIMESELAILQQGRPSAAGNAYPGVTLPEGAQYAGEEQPKSAPTQPKLQLQNTEESLTENLPEEDQQEMISALFPDSKQESKTTVDISTQANTEPEVSRETDTPDISEPIEQVDQADITQDIEPSAESLTQQIDAAANEAATSPTNDLPEPTDAQVEAGNYKKAHVKVSGLDISIENPKGSTRSGVDPDGNEWSVEIQSHYGYIKRSKGADDEQIDVFVGPNPKSEKVFVIDQVNKDGSFDEHKAMIAYDSKLKARSGYKVNYDKNWRVGPITSMSMEEFKTWVKEGDTSSPLNQDHFAGASKKVKQRPQKAVQDLKPDQGTNPDILSQPKAQYLKALEKERGIKKGSPGYKEARAELESEYEQALDRAQAELPFEEFNKLNSDTPENLNHQAWEALREDFGIEKSKKSGLRYSLAEKQKFDEKKARYSVEDQNKLGFYSGLKKAAESLKQEKGTASQMLAQIKKQPNVKAEELEWTGLEEFIAAKEAEGSKVTKKEIVQYLDGNGVQVEEVEYSSKFDEQEAVDEWLLQADAGVRQENGEYIASYGGFDILEKYDTEDAAWEALREEGLKQQEVEAEIETKYHKYVEPGGKNYREVLLKLPITKSKIATKNKTLPKEYEITIDSSYKETPYIVTRVDQAYSKPFEGRHATEQDAIDAAIEKIFIEDNRVLQAEASRNNYLSSHFDEPNILAHVRLNDRTDKDGNKVLFVEEVQSDWHQQGRKGGYNARSKSEKRHKELRDKMLAGTLTDDDAAELDQLSSDLSSAIDVPDAPFKNNAWAELAIKRILRIASEGGYDKVAWTTGDQQAERYDLSKHIESITYGQDNSLVAYDGSGDQVIGKTISESELEGAIGKEAAEKLINQEPNADGDRFLSNQDLKVGGEGMKGFYDRALPNLFKKIARKLDKSAEVSTTDFGEFQAHSVTLTDKAKASAMKGQSLFQKGTGKGVKPGPVRFAVKNLEKRVGVPVKVVATENDLPNGLKQQIDEDGASGQVRGLFDTANGTAYIVAGNLNTVQDALKVYLHEVVGHKGIRAATGSRLNLVLSSIYKSMSDTDIARIKSKYRNQVDGLDDAEVRRIIADEYVAELAESDPKHNFVQRVIAIVRDWLRSVFPDMKWSDNDIIALLKNGKKKLVEEYSSSDDGLRYIAVDQEHDLLAPQNKSLMAGDEDLIFDDGEFKGFQSSYVTATSRSFRYVKYDNDGKAIGVIQFHTKGSRSKKAEISNIYVRKDSRRNKVAASLLNRARQDFSVEHSKDLTNDGKAFADADGIAYQLKDISSSARKVLAQNPLVAAWTLLTQNDEVFQGDTSRAKSIEGVFDDIMGDLQVTAERFDKIDQDGAKAWKVKQKDTRRFGLVYVKGNQVWIDVSNWGKGGGGNQFYNAVANYAYNTGKTFVGDPAGLSDAGLARRLENMISSALKLGTTDHLWPHSRQQEGSKSVPAIKWKDGDYAHNLTEMIKASYRATLNQFPEIRDMVYNPETSQFERNGEVVTDEDFNDISDSGRKDVETRATDNGANSRSRQIGSGAGIQSPITAGRSTLKRAVITQTISRAQGGERSRILASLGGQQRQHPPESLKGILYSLEENDSSKPFSGIDRPQERMVDSILRMWADKMRPLKLTQRAIEKVTGKTIPEHLNAYMAEEAFHGKAENDLRKLREKYLEPLAKKLADYGVSREELDMFLWARHAEERNKHIAEINPDMPDGGSGMSTADARKVLFKAKQEGTLAKLHELSQFVYGMLKERRDLLSGNLLEEGEVDAWNAVYKFYVPLKGQASDEITPNYPRIGKGFDIRGKETLRALGRRTKPESPVLHSIKDTTETIIRNRKNEVGNVFLDLVQKYPDSDYWEVFSADSPEVTRKLYKRDGEEVVDTGPVADKSQYFITKKGGKEFYIKVKDPLVLRAMKNMGPQSMNGVVRFLGSVSRFLSAVNTSYNPEFMISNASRDIQAAVYNLLAEQTLDDGKVKGKKLAGKMVKGVPQAIRAIHASLYNKSLDGENAEWQRYFNEFREDGAKTGWFDMKDIDGQATELETMIAEASKNGLKGKALRVKRIIGNLVEHANTAIENGVRLSVYRAAREAGITRKKAASLAKGLTVNFNRKGEFGQTLNALYMFANASIQGTMVFARSIGTLNDADTKNALNLWTGKRLNAAQKVAVGMAISAYGLAMLNREMAGEDDDDENWYDKVPDYVKERNIVIMKSMFGGEPGKYWKIPLPYGYNIFHVMGTQAEAVANGKSIPEAAGAATKAALGSFSPLGVEDSKTVGGSVVKTMIPTVLSPFTDLYANENFYGGEIYFENLPFGIPKPDSQLYKTSTPEHWKEIAIWLNDVTGGSEYRSGIIDINPDAMGYLFDQFTGSAGAFYSRTGSAIEKLVKGETIEDKDTPFKRIISGEVSSFHDKLTFDERKTEVDQLHNEWKNLQGKDKFEFHREYGKRIQLRNLAKNTEKRARDIWKKIQSVQGSSLPEEEKRRRIERLEKQQAALYDKFNKRYKEAVND